MGELIANFAVGSLVHIRGVIMGRKAENVTLCMGHNTPMLQCIGLKKDSEFFSSCPITTYVSGDIIFNPPRIAIKKTQRNV